MPLHLTVHQSSSLKTTGAGNTNDSWFYWIDFYKFLDGYHFSSVTFLLDPFLNWISFHPFHMIIWIQKLRFLVSLFCCFDFESTYVLFFEFKLSSHLFRRSSECFVYKLDTGPVLFLSIPTGLESRKPLKTYTNLIQQLILRSPGTTTNWIHQFSHVSLNFPLQ